MRALLIVTFGIAIAFIFNAHCMRDRKQTICNDACLQKGFEFGSMESAYKCQCYGTQNGKVSRP